MVEASKKMPVSPGHHYRPDIDGLRALAVISVVSCHMRLGFFTGGFIGVDVFFVISGFLITGLIRERVVLGNFSFLDFYQRRIRRIFPSLLLVFTAALSFGWIALFNSEYRELSKGVFYGTAFYSNFFLLRQTGYFDQSSELKAFLHLWSLGIEEQFYFVWPILMVWLGTNRRTLGWTLGLVCLSFLSSLLLTANHAEAAFYLPFPRFWELGIGCALALGGDDLLRGPRSTQNLKAFAGIALVIVGVFAFDSSSLFPGWRALLPTIGAALIISAGEESWLNRFILSHPVALFFGLISYPLYLWHWLFLYFFRVMEAGNPSLLLRVLAVSLSVVFAWVSYRFVETPIRKNPRPGRVAALLFAANFVFTGISYCAVKYGNHHTENEAQGAVAGISQYVNAHPCTPATGSWKGEDLTDAPFSCESDVREKPVYAAFGDSHAGSLYPGLTATSNPNGRWMLINHLGCLPMLGVEPKCEKQQQAVVRMLREDSSMRFVLIAVASRNLSAEAGRFLMGQARLNKLPQEEVFRGLENFIRALESAHKKVGFLIDAPAITMHPDLCAPRLISITHTPNPFCSISKADFDTITREYRELVLRLQKTFPDLEIIDPTDIFCENGVCPVIHNGEFYYSFSDHVSDTASKVVGARISRWLLERKI